MLRTAREVADVVRENPFHAAERLEQTLHVGFMSVRIPAERVAALDPNRSPPDEFESRGRELYLRVPNGFARSKFTSAYFERVLGTAITFRNWRTVRRLSEMAEE